MNSVLIYHTISSPAEPLLADIDIAPQRFEQQLSWLSRRRQVVPLLETLRLDQRKHPVAITFDDGYRDNLTVALPLLEKYSMPATVFVSAGFVGDDGYVSRDDLRYLARHPLITIGAHGLWHRHFCQLSTDEAKTELIGARNVLTDITGRQVDLMAWPYGECDPRLEQLSAECGYRAAWSVWKGNNGLHSRWRVPLGRRDNMLRFVMKVSGVYAMTKARMYRFCDRHGLRTPEEHDEHHLEGVALDLKVR